LKSDLPRQKKKPKRAVNVSWIITIFFSTILISGLFSAASTVLLGRSTLVAAFFILLLIVFIGIFFDVIGVAVTAADTKPFHSMAAHRVPGAQEALKMLKNADKVSSFCNDVVGDICGVISGTASASIVLLILSNQGAASGRAKVIEIIMAALVSGLTVGGKAVGKTLAMTKSTQIVHMTALIVYYMKSLPKSARGLFHRKAKANHK
jgi:CBS domain containing-hemolysin-like protein